MSQEPFKMDEVKEDHIINHPSNPITFKVFLSLILILGIVIIALSLILPPKKDESNEKTQLVESSNAFDQKSTSSEISDVIHLTDEDFEKNIQSGVVLVDFYTKRCPPCKKMSPFLETVATEFKGKAKVVKIEAEENLQTAEKYHIEFYPTLYVLKDGKVVKSIVGMQSEDQLRSLIKEQID